MDTAELKIYKYDDTYMCHMIQKCNVWSVLECFLDEPEKPHQIRTISKKIGLATTSVKLHVNTLIQEQLVKEGKDIFKNYNANFDNERFRFLKKINNLNKIENSGLLEFLEEQIAPDVIILFGSTAKGEDISTSDIDIFIQSKQKKIDLSIYEKKLGRKIELFIEDNLAQLPKELKNNIINGQKLRGYLKIY